MCMLVFDSILFGLLTWYMNAVKQCGAQQIKKNLLFKVIDYITLIYIFSNHN